MKKKILVLLLSGLFLLGGCATSPSTQKDKNPNIKTQMMDLNGDGTKEIVETEDKFDTDSVCIVSVKRQKKNKEIQILDSFTVPGKIKKLDFCDLYFDSQKQIVIYFDDADKAPGITIYQLKNDGLSQIFFASSRYGIDAQLKSGVPRVRLGKASRVQEGSPNRMPDWEVWTWTGDKFIKE